MRNILLTGATGFIGKEVLRTSTVARVVSRRKFKTFENVDNFYVEDINGTTNWNNAFDGIDVIIHLAGSAHCDEDINYHRRINVDGTIKLAKDAAKSGVKRFVFVSTIGVNGLSTHDKSFSSDDSPHPHNAYSKTKLEAEKQLLEISKKTGIEIVIIRPTLVYGKNAPGNFKKLVDIIVKLPLFPFGMIKNKRSFISVSNLANLLVLCSHHPGARGEVFLASEFSTVSTREFVSEIGAALNKKVYHLPIPSFLIKHMLGVMGKKVLYEQLFSSLVVDTNKLQEKLNWSPPYTMRESLARLRESYD